MNIGELFLNLGVKGSEKTLGALSNAQKGLKETASVSLEAKAAIIAAFYALEQLFALSGKTGTGLTNFNSLLGVSTQTLQQYQYAARQAGVSNEEVASSFKSIQQAMTKTLMGEGAPKGLARVSLLTGGITSQDIDKFAKEPELLIQRLQQYATKEKNVGLRNEVLKSFGLGEGVVSALSRQAFRPEVLKKAPTYSNQEIGALDKANIAWSNLGTKIQMAFGHFNAMHGGQLVNDISKIITQIIRLADALTTLAEKLHVFQGVAKIFELMNNALSFFTTHLDAASKNKKGLLPGFLEEDIKIIKSGGQLLGGFVEKTGESILRNFLPEQGGKSEEPKSQLSKTVENIKTISTVEKTLHSLPESSINESHVVPQNMTKNVSGNTQNNNVSIQNSFAHPGTDHKKTGESMKQSIERAYRQMFAQSQGT